jgi:spermidine/putrescine ABC transporter ATP-binding subunit
MHDNKVTSCVELQSVVKRFPGVVAVDQVHLEIEEGKIFSLLGPSGCGKTTILRMIGGFETPDEGNILIDGKIVNETPPFKRDCSMVFQDLALFPHMSVEQNIAFGLERKKIPKNEITKRIGEMLALADLEGMEKRRPNQLSGGQQQRVALVRSLILKPKILLLDEPLASLDRKLRKEMQVELKRIQREVGTTFFYVTHDQKVALTLSDTIGVMLAGKIEQIGTPNEIYETPKTEFVAKFMGALNVFTGKIKGRNKGIIEMEIQEGLVICAPEPKGITVEKVTGISVHPEMIGIMPAKVKYDEAELHKCNKLQGQIKDKFYQGDFTELTVSLNQTDRLINVHLSRRPDQKAQYDLNKGEDVLIYWRMSNSNVLTR